MKAYYELPAVRARMIEFLGGSSVHDLTAQYVTVSNREELRHRVPCLTSTLPSVWAGETDLGRSLWDRRWLVAHLDIEYVNFDFPALAYREPGRIFEVQQPVERAVEAVLLDYGIVPLHLLSGRGHHFVWQIRQNSAAFKQLAALGRVTPTLDAIYAQSQPPEGKTVPPALGAAFAGLGLVMEYVAHRVKEIAAPTTAIPVELTAVEVGPSGSGREMVSLDISEYGDPLHTRVVRVPFSLYLKPWQQRAALGDDIVKRLPPVFLIPLHEMDSERGWRVMRDIGEVARLAALASTRIPDQTAGMRNLIAAYRRSPLAKFHGWFHSQEHEPPARWPETYDRTPLDPLPACARHILQYPNDLLLRPANIERIVRVMLALGWHPRHIAGLIRSKFERDHAWRDQWQGYDPATRADFYTRVFAGLFATGHDNLVDFNCQSAKEEKLCFLADCPDNLEHYRESLLNRRSYERLASRPFNGLFLPAEHSRLP
jgi:hypothetical protein